MCKRYAKDDSFWGKLKVIVTLCFFVIFFVLFFYYMYLIKTHRLILVVSSTVRKQK